MYSWSATALEQAYDKSETFSYLTMLDCSKNIVRYLTSA